jgi:hypothetical protein
MITLLVNSGANIHIQNNKGDSLLHDAIRCESLEVAKIL